MLCRFELEKNSRRSDEQKRTEAGRNETQYYLAITNDLLCRINEEKFCFILWRVNRAQNITIYIVWAMGCGIRSPASSHHRSSRAETDNKFTCKLEKKKWNENVVERKISM